MNCTSFDDLLCYSFSFVTFLGKSEPVRLPAKLVDFSLSRIFAINLDCFFISRSLCTRMISFSRSASSKAWRSSLTLLHIAFSLNKNCRSSAYFLYLRSNSFSVRYISSSLKYLRILASYSNFSRTSGPRRIFSFCCCCYAASPFDPAGKVFD